MAVCLLAGDKAYTLNIDKAENSSDLMLYLNARGQRAGGKQCASGKLDQPARTEAQASSLKETAAAMEN